MEKIQKIENKIKNLKSMQQKMSAFSHFEKEIKFTLSTELPRYIFKAMMDGGDASRRGYFGDDEKKEAITLFNKSASKYFGHIVEWTIKEELELLDKQLEAAKKEYLDTFSKEELEEMLNRKQ